MTIYTFKSAPYMHRAIVKWRLKNNKLQNEKNPLAAMISSNLMFCLDSWLPSRHIETPVSNLIKGKEIKDELISGETTICCYLTSKLIIL